MQFAETFLQTEEYAYPHGNETRKGKAIYPDGKIRTVRAGIPDTYFSIPAHGRFRGHYVTGWLHCDDATGSPELYFEFTRP